MKTDTDRFSIKRSELSLLDRLDVEALIANSPIPIFIFPDVTLMAPEKQELGVFERFLLEAAVLLSTFALEEIAGITSVPEPILQAVTQKLCRLGALSQTPESGYFAATGKATRILSDGTLTVGQKKRPALFLCFPRTHDVMVFTGEQMQSIRRRFSRMKPLFQAPVPAELTGRNRLDYFRRRLEQGSIAGLPEEVTDVEMSGRDEPFPELCPCYMGEGPIRRVGSELKFPLRIFGLPKKDTESGSNPCCKIEAHGASGLVERVLGTMQKLGTPEALQGIAAAAGAGTRSEFLRQAGPSEWVLILDGPSAAEAAETRLITEPVGVEFSTDEIVLELMVRFAPGDDAAAAIFQADRIVGRLAASEEGFAAAGLNTAVLADAGETNGADVVVPAVVENVKNRMWQLGYFHWIYVIREATDFGYD